MTDLKLDKVLIICGPTATGKTKLGLQLAERFGGDLISADSRQVYQGLDVITGKDIPPGFIPEEIQLKNWGKTTVYRQGQIHIWGLDLVDPHQEWSAGQFRDFSQAALEAIRATQRLPIIVGGTGLYLKAISDSLPLAGSPPDKKYRQELEKLSLPDLQEKLKAASAQKWAQMNPSDQKNPRRLVRALEIIHFGIEPKAPISQNKGDFLSLGLTAPLEYLDTAIKNRVEQRATADLAGELALWQSLPTNVPAKSSLGYEELDQYQRGKISRQELIEKWLIRERQYARRQLTWFKKQPKINWFDVSQENWQAQVVALVNSWYSSPKV